MPAGAVTINPIFATTYTGDDLGVGPLVSLNSDPTTEMAIRAAARTVGGMLTDTHTTVNILFYDAPKGGFLGASLTGAIAYTYNDYVAALKADAAAHPYNITLATALRHMSQGNGAADPLHTFVAPTTPDARALHLGLAAPTSFGPADSTPEFNSTGTFVGSGGTVDAIVLLSSAVPLCTRPVPSPATRVCFDIQTTMEHEIDEVLGIGGPGSTLNDLLADPKFAQDFFGVNGTVLGPLDLYRYAAPGTPSYALNTDPSDPNQPRTAYFSVDGGGTPIDFFNQQFMTFGDASDWAFTGSTCPGGMFHGGLGYVQDAFGCNNTVKDVGYGTPERQALEAIGYDIPEPSTLLIFGATLAGAVGMRRRGASARTAR
jgi:hypothetical protein